MPATEGLQPPMTKQEREVIKTSWDSWTHFMQSHELKAHDHDDIGEAKLIVEAYAAAEGKKEETKTKK